MDILCTGVALWDCGCSHMPCEHIQFDSTTEKLFGPRTKKMPKIDIDFWTKVMVHKLHFTEYQDSMHPIVCGY